MPRLELNAYPDTAGSRRELVAFLTQHWKSQQNSGWERRMGFWWDENPVTKDHSERGHWVHADGHLVGFGGSIPALHTFEGESQAALYATTLCVDESFPKAAALIFLKQRELVEKHIITHATPNPRVQKALLKMGARAETTVTRHFFPAGIASLLRGRSWWPSFPANKKLVTDPAAVESLIRPYQRAGRIEKWITPEYLRWFCSSPGRTHHFLGVVDGAGVLSSYLLVTPRQVKGLRSWDVLETFTTNDDSEELNALIGMLVKHPELLPGGAMVVTAATFPEDTAWDRTPALLRRTQQVCHFSLMPEALKQVPKHTVMAEGDIGL
jgi:hypothetical protein